MLVGRWPPFSVHWTIYPLTQDLSTSMLQAHSLQSQPGLTSVTYLSAIIHSSIHLFKPPLPIKSRVKALNHLSFDHWDSLLIDFLPFLSL